jgi:hypothetical protein
MATMVRIEFKDGSFTDYTFRGNRASWRHGETVKSTTREHALGYLSWAVKHSIPGTWVRVTVFSNGRVRVLRSS